MGKEFSEHRERFGTIKGLAGGIVPEMGVKLTVIGHMRECCPQVILSRRYTKPREVLEIYALGYLKGAGDKYLFFIIWWEVS